MNSHDSNSSRTSTPIRGVRLRPGKPRATVWTVKNLGEVTNIRSVVNQVKKIALRNIRIFSRITTDPHSIEWARRQIREEVNDPMLTRTAEVARAARLALQRLDRLGERFARAPR
jgi:hypothetical protein